MLEYGSLLLLGSLIAVIWVLVLFHKKKLDFADDKQLRTCVRWFAVVPFAFNVSILGSLLSMVFLQLFFPMTILALVYFSALMCAGVSAVFGVPASLFGLYCAIRRLKAQEGKRVRYVIFACVSLVLSLQILSVFLKILIPNFLSFYGFR